MIQNRKQASYIKFEEAVLALGADNQAPLGALDEDETHMTWSPGQFAPVIAAVPPNEQPRVYATFLAASLKAWDSWWISNATKLESLSLDLDEETLGFVREHLTQKGLGAIAKKLSQKS